MLFSQDQESFIVDLDGDSTFGQVNWIGDPFFIENISLDGEKFELDQLIAFSNGNKLYQLKQDSLWCKVRVIGSMSLFQHKETYYAQKEDQWVWLENDQYVLEGYGYSKVKTTNRYRKILNYLMSDCGDFQQELSRVKYADKPLIKVVEAYNLCTRAPYVVFK